MNSQINCFIPFRNTEQATKTIKALRSLELVNKVYLLADTDCKEYVAGCTILKVGSLQSTNTIMEIVSNLDKPYALIYTKYAELEPGMFALDRMLQVAKDSDAGLIYADHYQMADGVRKDCPVTDYQKGSIEDDFNFGSVLLYKSECIKKAVLDMRINYKFAGLYDLRLKVSQEAPLVHIDEYLYTEVKNEMHKSGAKVSDCLDTKNIEVQTEMELACASHLKKMEAYLESDIKEIDPDAVLFDFEASVIMPVCNGTGTIGDAIESVLKQKTNFSFNIIVIDSYPIDGTIEVIRKFEKDERVIHHIPANTNLSIGECWNAGVFHEKCGKFAVQLDSDDVYSDENVLQKIVDTFYEQKCAMVVGSYALTDFDTKQILPAEEDRKEWTPKNGRNNALRINPLGAPSAFYTPLLRKIKVPNTNFGAGYALGLRLSREYRIGHIYDVLCLRRRRDDDSTTVLDVEKINAHNRYIDHLRTWELEARISMNKG